MSAEDSQYRERSDLFSTTHWSLVLTAQGSDSIPAGEALATLCETYWYPLYIFVRSRGNSSHDAQDLTQSFFEKLLEKNYLVTVSREKGRFRAFLLASMKHFLANEWHRSRAAKRGGGRIPISLDDTDAEARYQLEPLDLMTPELLFERRWAMTLLDQVLMRLRNEMSGAGKIEIFEGLKDVLSTGKNEISYSEIGEGLGMSEGAARTAAHRLKKRYRELLRDEIGKTVADSTEIEDEIRYLIVVLGAKSRK